MLLQVSVRELQNNMAVLTEEGGLKEATENNNIIICDSLLCNLMSAKIKKLPTHYKVMCGYECCIYPNSMNLYLLIWRDIHTKRLKDRSHNAQIRRSGEIVSHIFETHKNYIKPHGCHIHKKHLTWLWKQYVPVILYIIICLIGNVCYVVVINVQVLS